MCYSEQKRRLSEFYCSFRYVEDEISYRVILVAVRILFWSSVRRLHETTCMSLQKVMYLATNSSLSDFFPLSIYTITTRAVEKNQKCRNITEIERLEEIEQNEDFRTDLKI